MVFPGCEWFPSPECHRRHFARTEVNNGPCKNGFGAMKAICKWIVTLPGVVIVATGCALPGLNHAKFARGESQLSLARRYEQEGKAEEAARIYLSLIQSTPNQAEPYHRLGVIAAASGEYARAEQYFLRAQSLDPHDADLLNDLGYVQLLQGRLSEAENFLRLALRNDPQHARAKNNLGMVLGRRGRLQESLAMFRQVVPEAEARQNLAQVAEQSADAVDREDFDEPVTRLAAGAFAPNEGTGPGVAQRPTYAAAAAPAAPSPHRVMVPVTRTSTPLASRPAERPHAVSPRPSGGLAASGSGETPAPARRTTTNLPRLFEQPTWSRGSWSSDRVPALTGATGEAPSAAQRTAQQLQDRLQHRPSDEMAAVAAARAGGLGGGRQWRTAEAMQLPRLFGPPTSAPR